MDRIDCTVIGAGVVGLAIARALTLSGRETLILEAADAIGTGTSSRNSEIIHAGIYYPKDSLKARFCVRGNELLYNYCASHGVEHRRCGKLIVATDEAQIDDLNGIRERAEENGVPDLEWLDGKQLAKLEPGLRAVGGYLSPSTGIVDSHALMLAYQGDFEDAGGVVAFNSPLVQGLAENGNFLVEAGSEERFTFNCGILIVSAGLDAQAVAGRITGLPPETIPKRYLAKGNYFTLSGRSPFSRPIYPVPEAAGLGVHLTVDLGGQAKFGPDVEWIDEIDYTVDPARADKFYEAIRRYWPDLPDGSLQPGYAGIRPKLQAPGEPPADFVIQDASEHGVKGLINLYGIESPGLTSSLAIAEEIVRRLENDGIA